MPKFPAPKIGLTNTLLATGVLTLVVATGTPVEAASLHSTKSAGGRNHAFAFQTDASFILDMRSGGVEEQTALPAALYQDVGYSEVNLAHDIGAPQGSCDSGGAVYYLGQYLEEAVLGKGAAPPDAGDVSGGYHNPLYSRDVEPNISAGNSLSNRHPGLANPVPPGQELVPVPGDGSPVLAKSHCDSDLKGTSEGAATDLAGLADAVSSTTSAEFNRETGEYVSTGRAYIAGLKNAGNLNTISSFMQVDQKPGAQPTVSYRLSILFAGADGSGSGGSGINLSGTNVPVDQLTGQFNSQARTLADAASALGPFGLQILAPQTGIEPSTEAGTTGLHFISAPVVATEAGSHLRDGTLGQDTQQRLGSVTFTGVYGQESRN